MYRKLYFMSPDINSAHALLDDLLLARVPEKHMRFWAKGNTLPADFPGATFLQKTDLMHGAEMGAVVGGAIGLLLGILLIALFPVEGAALLTIGVLAAVVVGALFGAWASGMVAAAIPNSRLKGFQDEIEHGQVLLILDLPNRKVEQIQQLLSSRHPEVRFGGQDPHTPVFP